MRYRTTVTVLLVACTVTVDPGTGVTVEVRRGPITPVTLEGVDNTAPVAGAVVRVADLRGSERGRGVTDGGGLASVTVAAGSYQATVVTCPGAMAVPAPASVTVTAGVLTQVRLECDTGIR